VLWSNNWALLIWSLSGALSGSNASGIFSQRSGTPIQSERSNGVLVLMSMRLPEILNNVLSIVVFTALSIGQSAPTTKAKPTPRPIVTFDVRFEPDPKLSFPFDEGGYPAIFSEGCDASGNPYVRVQRVIPPHNTEVLKFAPKGMVTFETSRISDVVEPKWIADFVSDSELYMLIEGDTRTEQKTKKTEDGKNAVDWETKGEPRYYIAQFDSDGSYKRALKLDLPFRPTRLSGFTSGNFLTIGSDEKNVSRVALLDSGGQLLRYIEFPREKQEIAQKTIARSSGVNATHGFAGVIIYGYGSFFQYQDRNLYVRSRTGAPIYAIGAGGEAQAVKIKAIEGYSVEYLLPSDQNWFVVSAEQGKFSGGKSVIYEVNPSSGEFLNRYLAPGSGRTKSVAEGQSDLACVHEGEFISVRHQDGKLTVLRGTPVPAKGQARVP
jgi:hypothetical protein